MILRERKSLEVYLSITLKINNQARKMREYQAGYPTILMTPYPTTTVDLRDWEWFLSSTIKGVHFLSGSVHWPVSTCISHLKSVLLILQHGGCTQKSGTVEPLPALWPPVELLSSRFLNFSIFVSSLLCVISEFKVGTICFGLQPQGRFLGFTVVAQPGVRLVLFC